MDQGRNSKVLLGIAGVHYVVAELSRRNIIALPTTRNTEEVDIIASNPNTGKAISIQAKTSQNKKSDRPNWLLTKGAERLKKSNLFYVFVYLPKGAYPDFYIVPSDTVSSYITDTHKMWLKTPGTRGKPHKDSSIRQFPNEFKSIKLDDFKDKWELLGLWVNSNRI